MALIDRQELTQARVRELFSYDEYTGVLTCLIKRKRANAGTPAGWKDTGGRLQVSIDGRIYLVHRVIWLYMTGAWPKAQIDHCDMNHTNNRWSNLREATHAQNQWNRPAHKPHKLKGAFFVRAGKFRAIIRQNGKPYHLGYFATEAAAHAAYCHAAKILHNEFARAA